MKLGSTIKMRMAPELNPDVWRGQENISSMKYALKSVPGLADVGVPHGDGDGPRIPPRCLEGSGKIVKRLIFLCLSIYLL